MTSASFFPERLSTKPLGKAVAQKKILHWVYDEVNAHRVDLEYAMDKIERASEISPFPPTVIIPEAVYDFDFNIVVHASVTLHKGKRFVYLIIELSAPSVLYMDRSMFLGVMAHEFLHYAVHTVNFQKKILELESKGDYKSPIIVGVIPDKEKMTVNQRDRYFYSNPNLWFNDNEVIKAVEDLDAGIFKTSNLADKVMEWIKEGKPMKEYKRGEITGFRGKLWLHQPIIDKAKRLGML